MSDSSLVRILRAMAHLLVDPQHPHTEPERTESQHRDPDYNKIVGAIDALAEAYKTSKEKRDEHDGQVFKTDKRRLIVETVAMAFAVLAGVATVVTLR